MPTLEYSDDELGLSPGWDNDLDPNIRRELRQARVNRREAESLKAEVETLRRERVLSRAGIPSDRRGELFARTYEGSLEDPEAVKSAYEDLFGPIGAGAGAPQGDPAAVDRRIAEAGAAGDGQGIPGSVDFADAIRAAKGVDEVKELIRHAPDSARSQDGYRMRLAED